MKEALENIEEDRDFFQE